MNRNGIRLTAVKYQHGLSKFGMLIIVLFIATLFTVGIKVVPMYLDHALLTGLAEDMVTSGQANEMTQAEVRNKFSETLRINNVTEFDVSNIRVTKSNGKAIVRIAYERRANIVANLDIVAVFDETIQ